MFWVPFGGHRRRETVTSARRNSFLRYAALLAGKAAYSYSMATSTISQKGQITIPKDLRDRLGLTVGTIIEFSAENGKLVATKLVQENPFARWAGRGSLPVGTDEYLKITRDGHSG